MGHRTPLYFYTIPFYAPCFPTILSNKRLILGFFDMNFPLVKVNNCSAQKDEYNEPIPRAMKNKRQVFVRSLLLSFKL